MLGLALTTEDFVEPLEHNLEGELTPEDLSILGQGEVVGATPIKKLRARHHSLAKAIAAGMRPGIAAHTYGYTPATVSKLLGDPSFSELVQHYQQTDDHDFAQAKERLAALSVEAMDEIEHRLENEPEDITFAQLMRLAELALDRTGHGPKQTQDVNVNIGIAERLRAARENAERGKIEAAETPTIEGTIADEN